ncbi:hypothetical protein FHW67_003971 [Herbaspirillum sp. Sphag1AN]|uniref:DUF2946 family protein n=1 Tax=unclassified Herbaspirillum TaxID=2624150 RepID=UPI0016146D63|nr:MULTISPECIES: DUF2946 family protein [unclassified Herbaspirillum]MBB3214649.1 hypothetical protein [Herbaspirillum sp. Sphag1AN]MBB3247845.1 hypothetical protein [Herbaspirillum sp. Sphag64]
MDDIVRQAMTKWPNVPHCFGWLRLDARGYWRMRDTYAQENDLPGTRIDHATLIGFINRNYGGDDTGRWFFQNGPQRVYVDLELTPYIVRTDPTADLKLHTDEPLQPTAAWLTERGQLLLASPDKVATLDDRDGAALFSGLHCAGEHASEEQVLQWLDGSTSVQLEWRRGNLILPVQRIDSHSLETHFKFVAQPRADETA